MAGLYQSDWNPPGVKKTWERCSMTLDSTERAYGDFGNGAAMTEAVGWFDDDGACRCVVMEYVGGRRVIVKHLARSTKITFSRSTPDALKGDAK